MIGLVIWCYMYCKHGAMKKCQFNVYNLADIKKTLDQCLLFARILKRITTHTVCQNDNVMLVHYIVEPATTIAATLGALEKWLFKTCVAVYSRLYCNVINKLCIRSGCHL